MMKQFLHWLSSTLSPRKASSDAALDRTGAHRSKPGAALSRTGGHTVQRSAAPKAAVPERQPEYVKLDPHVEGRIEDAGPGKNVLIRSKYVREDTGTHETLKILDDSIFDHDEEAGIDPYNTGQFDRSRNWDKRRQ